MLFSLRQIKLYLSSQRTACPEFLEMNLDFDTMFIEVFPVVEMTNP